MVESCRKPQVPTIVIDPARIRRATKHVSATTGAPLPMPFAGIRTIRRGRSNSHRLNRCCGSLMRSHGAGLTRRNSGAAPSRDSSRSTIECRKTRSPQVPTVRTARGLTSQGSCPLQRKWCHKCLTSSTRTLRPSSRSASASPASSTSPTTRSHHKPKRSFTRWASTRIDPPGGTIPPKKAISGSKVTKTDLFGVNDGPSQSAGPITIRDLEDWNVAAVGRGNKVAT